MDGLRGRASGQGRPISFIEGTEGLLEYWNRQRKRGLEYTHTHTYIYLYIHTHISTMYIYVYIYMAAITKEHM